ncbi:MAG: DUF362 domain-containing protein [Anaerolineales bacterium]
MRKISRRKFLSLFTQSAGAAAVFQLLEACGIKPAAAPGTATSTPFGPLASGVDNGISIANAPGSTNTPLPSDTLAPTAEAATVTPSPTSDFAYLAVARGGDDPEALTRAAVAAIGGIGKFVPRGAKVLIKPNACVIHDYTYAATTNPWVVGALVKMCFEAGAGKVLVFDFPFGGTCAETYKASKIEEQATAAGAQMEYVDTSKFVQTNLPNGHSLHSAKFYSEVVNADVVINVPIAKNHSTTWVTLGMKNLMGTIHDRGAIHSDVLDTMDQRIADLAMYIRPELTVVDAVRIMMKGGPQGTGLRNVVKLDTVIASADIVAVDAYATKLFAPLDPSNNFYKMILTDPNNLGYVKYGAEWGIGRSDLANLKISEISVG